MPKIKEIHAEEILDSRGNPTIKTTVVLNDKTTASASCPSGASVGKYEAAELRDNDINRYKGNGVLKAVDNVNSMIAPKIIGMDAGNQQLIDKAMIALDGTPNKSRLGANAMLSVSMSVCRAASQSALLPLYLYIRQFIKREGLVLKIPTPLFNIINGGKHAINTLDFQEFFLIPASSKPYSECLQIGVVVYHALKKVLQENQLSTLVGDEGGFGPNLSSNLDPFSFMKKALESENLRFGFDVFFGIDAASNSFFNNSDYYLKERSKRVSAKELISYYEEINKTYPLLILEDGISEDDIEGWQNLCSKLASQSIIVGDDLTVTNPYRLQMAIDKKAITGIIIKPNQIGTISETIAVVEVAREADLKIIVSHRSGETNDDFIADFAVGVASDYVKFGAPARGERIEKYNRLLHIERQLTQINSEKK